MAALSSWDLLDAGGDSAQDGSVREDVGAVKPQKVGRGRWTNHVLSLVKWPGVRGAGRGLPDYPTLPPAPADLGRRDKEEPGVALREEGHQGGPVLGPERHRAVPRKWGGRSLLLHWESKGLQEGLPGGRRRQLPGGRGTGGPCTGMGLEGAR